MASDWKARLKTSRQSIEMMVPAIMFRISWKTLLPFFFVAAWETALATQALEYCEKSKWYKLLQQTVKGQFWCTDIQVMRSTLFNCCPLFSSSALVRHLNQQHLSYKTYFLLLFFFFLQSCRLAACHCGCINLGQKVSANGHLPLQLFGIYEFFTLGTCEMQSEGRRKWPCSDVFKQ